MKLSKTKIAFVFCLSFLVGAPFVYGAQIKNLTDIRGARSNQLFGYGIVTGLAGQGDSRIEYTERGILNALERLGIPLRSGYANGERRPPGRKRVLGLFFG